MKAIWLSHIIFLMKAHALNLILSQSAPVLIRSVKFQRFFQLMMSTEDHLSLQNYWSSLDGTRGKQFNNKPFVLFGFPFSFASKCFLSVLHSQIKQILLSVFSLEPEKHQWFNKYVYENGEMEGCVCARCTHNGVCLQ